ncbi:response regulator transcription factor [Streptomyces sp. NPDC091371]|uniref:response regulator transcription factor n=1 Tax=Streptomyces sp. NPDC091371 TaxID=3155303 RepID=UPI00343BD2D6
MATLHSDRTHPLADQQTDVPIAHDSMATYPRPRRVEACSTRTRQGRGASDCGGEPADEKSPSRALTPRQLEVLALLTEGMTNRHIARALGITEKTVKNHLHAIFARLDVSDRTQAAIYALRHDRAA